jgi:hypothetical protein
MTRKRSVQGEPVSIVVDVETDRALTTDEWSVLKNRLDWALRDCRRGGVVRLNGTVFDRAVKVASSQRRAARRSMRAAPGAS